MSQIKNNTKRRKFEHLTYVKRSQIEVLLKAKLSKTQIAAMLNISRATLYREIERGTVEQKNSDWTFRKQYFADVAQNDYEKKRENSHRKSLRPMFESQLAELKKIMKKKNWSIAAAFSTMPLLKTYKKS